ncbi:DUF4147 domain-containing protein [Maritalea porphyrae]|uniref:DUF4147 domain-containing protein n=1 Tax=Maritalea porphyrae TaxID=880732 RepID=UPI0022B03DD9|nr:DUF4147 domain-containing protein [Maritalea porphyrae]MCZ4271038.1 DUF4147 domain-containing protein [Maritalea porphyrae]
MLKSLFEAGINAVFGENTVQDALLRLPLASPVHVLAIGKAAASMMQGTVRANIEFETALLITKNGHVDRSKFAPDIEIMEAAHPLPDQSSLEAGARLLQWIKALPQNSTLLFLVSGGASSLVEVLVPTATVDQLVSLNKKAMAQGLEIGEINKQRSAISAIKGGKLLSHFGGRQVCTLYISDVRNDAIQTVGSGIGASPLAANFVYECHVVGSNALARDKIVLAAQDQNIHVVENEGLLFDDVTALAPMLARRVLEGPAGLYVWGGESTVQLPQVPGVGGRNQSLGLLFAKEIAGQSGINGLFTGTDGTDGPTPFAGALVNGSTFFAQPGAQTALDTADSSTYLKKCGAIFETGPTGTNVMDLALVFKD